MKKKCALENYHAKFSYGLREKKSQPKKPTEGRNIDGICKMWIDLKPETNFQRDISPPKNDAIWEIIVRIITINLISLLPKKNFSSHRI